MKNILIVLILWASFSHAQKHDYTWLQGYDSHLGFDTSTNHYFGITIFDFNSDPRLIFYDSLEMNFDRTNTSFSDSNGRLTFYSNGIYVANSLDEKVENGDSLNAGGLQYWWDPTIQQYGYRTPQGIVALQSLSNSSQYYLLHTYMDTGALGQIYWRRLYYTLIDMSLNGGHGKVLAKNQTVIDGNLGGAIAVIRHGNGRDWWILVQKRNSNCYYKVLLSKEGVQLLPNSLCGGSVTFYGDIDQFAVSPDGSKVVYFSVEGGINIFDFDRCAGELSNAIIISIPDLIDSGWVTQGAVISPNSRFLYISCSKYLFQYDLWSANIQGSVDTIGVMDTALLPFYCPFLTMQLGPDGKIYGSCGNSDYAYHVIDRPDEKGDSCMLNQHGLMLPSFCIGLPYFPNYRLKALTGSLCDTLTALNETARVAKEKILHLFPNPATDLLTIDYGFTDWSKGDVRLEITSETGQQVYSQALPRYSGFQKINVSAFSTGVYQVSIKRKGEVVAVSRFAKE